MRSNVEKSVLRIILLKVGDVLGASESEIVSESRKAEYVAARQIFCHIVQNELGVNPADACEIINRDRSSVYYSAKVCEDRIKHEPRFNQIYAQCVQCCELQIEKHRGYANYSKTTTASLVPGAKSAGRTGARLEQIVSICSMAQASRSKVKGKPVMRVC